MSMSELKLMTMCESQQAPYKHNHTRIPNFMWKTLPCRGKNHGTVSKNIHYEIEITTIKFKLESTINWIYNK